MAYAKANKYIVLTHNLDFSTILAATHGRLAKRHATGAVLIQFTPLVQERRDIKLFCASLVSRIRSMVS